MKILLIHPSWRSLYGSYRWLSRRANLHPPLGLCYLAAAVQEQGHEAAILDLEIEDSWRASLATAVADFHPDCIGITATTPLIAEASRLAGVVRALFSLPVILGGPHVTIEKNKVLEAYPAFDYAVVGEGERSLPQLLENFGDYSRLLSVDGIIFRRPEGDLCATKPAARAQDLDSLPIPARQLLKLERYRWSVPGKSWLPTASVMASRGCPFKCIFCNQDAMFSKIVRFHSVARIISELDLLLRTSVARHFVFNDDSFTLNRIFVEDLCMAIIEQLPPLTFECETRGNLLDADLIMLLRRAGLVRINVGLESADPAILTIIKKEVPLDISVQALKEAKQQGIETRATILLGHPGETRKSAQHSIRLVRNLRYLDQPYINLAAPYPGTELRRLALMSKFGLRLLDSRYEALTRYGNCVIAVNDLLPADLIKLQRWGLLSCYLQPRRLWYNLKRAGWSAGFKLGLAFVAGIVRFGSRNSGQPQSIV